MKTHILSLVVLGAVTVTATSAIAEPVKLSSAQLDKVVAGAPPGYPPGLFPPGQSPSPHNPGHFPPNKK